MSPFDYYYNAIGFSVYFLSLSQYSECDHSVVKIYVNL